MRRQRPVSEFLRKPKQGVPLNSVNHTYKFKSLNVSGYLWARMRVFYGVPNAGLAGRPLRLMSAVNRVTRSAGHRKRTNLRSEFLDNNENGARLKAIGGNNGCLRTGTGDVTLSGLFKCWRPQKQPKTISGEVGRDRIIRVCYFEEEGSWVILGVCPVSRTPKRNVIAGNGKTQSL